jgi:cyclin-dependent kinase 7
MWLRPCWRGSEGSSRSSRVLLTSHMEKYQVETQIAEGGGGWVFRAVDPDKGVKVALKKIKRDEKDKDGTWGMSVPALREIKFLQELRHENVIELMDVFKHDNFVYLVFPLMPSDLDKVIQTTPLTAGNIKAFMEMILEGVGFLHANWILHRDIKPDNFLVTNDSILKIMDLGLSKAYGTEPGTMHGRMTNAVATMGYKCPELLLGADSYGPAIDAWSCGCVFAEMMLRWAPSPPPSLPVPPTACVPRSRAAGEWQRYLP